MSYAKEPVLASGTKKGRICDVGSGVGALVNIIQKEGIPYTSIVGVDISPEMVRLASEKYPQCNFVRTDFLEYQGGNNEKEEKEKREESSSSSNELQLFDTMLFCMSLHDLPNPMLALKHAVSLTRANGRIVISHPRGGKHVRMQHLKNPIMVPNELPNESELEKFCQEINSGGDSKSIKVLLAPANSGTAEDEANGYLAVLEVN